MIDTSRHDLDLAIDRVAAKLVAVTDDERLMQRVMTGLPERTASPWLATMPVQFAAAAALLLVAFLYARPAREARPVAAPLVAALAPVRALPVAEPSPLPTPVALIAEPRSPIPPSPRLWRAGPDPRSPIPDDHDRSLAPVTPLPVLELTSILPAALEPDAAIELAPLVLTDLPLAGDFISPREP